MAFAEHLITLKSGRTLAIAETGDARGAPTLFCHPAPGSRLLDPDPDATAKAGVRLITFDRPGYGKSTALPRFPLPTVGGYADDIAEALTTLGVDTFDAIGWSGGGRVALALAANHASRVKSVAIMGTPAPDDQVRWIPDEYNEMIAQLAPHPETAIAAMAPMFAALDSTSDNAFALLGSGAAEKAVLAADPARKARVAAMLKEAFAQNGEGLAAEIAAYTLSPLDYPLANISARVRLFYSESDIVVGPAHGDWYLSQIRDAQLTTIPEAGHLMALTMWGAMLACIRW